MKFFSQNGSKNNLLNYYHFIEKHPIYKQKYRFNISNRTIAEREHSEYPSC